MQSKQRKQTQRKEKTEILVVFVDDLHQLCEGVVGFECVSNLGHVGDLVAIKTVYSFIHLKHTPTYTYTQKEEKYTQNQE